jgi:hypothetical protein
MLGRSRVGMLATAVIVVCLSCLSGMLSAQGRREQAFERVRAVQERHTEKMMAAKGVVGTAIGLDENGEHAVLVLLETPRGPDLPQDLEGIPVRAIVTGPIYALAYAPPSVPQTTTAADTTAPAAPLGLTAQAVSSRQIDLRWTANWEADVDRYHIYRSGRSLGPYSRIGSIPKSPCPAYSDLGLRPDTMFYYVVTAVDTSGNQSRRSNLAAARTPFEIQEVSIGPRPAPLGVSTGHPKTTAGTIGCRVYKEVAGGIEYYALSNNHVYADENRASLGDSVLQPGPYDYGRDPRDKIGTLADFQAIVFSAFARNEIDAAIALCTPQTLGNSTADGRFTPSRTTVPATVGLTVKKYGRTTGLTHGRVHAVNASVNVTYDSGSARFVRQIVIAPDTFCAGGDSGSLIVTEEGNHPVGLLFAAGTSYTIANPIDTVLSRFGATIDGQ